MLVLRDRYLDNNQVRGRPGSYSKILNELLTNDDTRIDPGTSEVSKKAGLHKPAGEGGRAYAILTPPSELVALIEELGHTDAIDAFVQDSIDERALSERTRRECREHVENVIAEAEELYGRDGLSSLYYALGNRLGIQGLLVPALKLGAVLHIKRTLAVVRP